MGPKAIAIGLDVMKLASALAVIRDNEGYGAIFAILEKLQVTIHPSVICLQTSLDKALLSQVKITRKAA